MKRSYSYMEADELIEELDKVNNDIKKLKGKKDTYDSASSYREIMKTYKHEVSEIKLHLKKKRK